MVGFWGEEGRVGAGRVDVKEEMNFCENSKKKKRGVRSGVRFVGGGGGQGRCER